MNNKEDEGNSSPYEVFSDSDTDSDQAQRPRSPRAPTNGQGHQQICRCAQGSQTRRLYDFDDQSSGDNVVYYTDSSEYYSDEDGNYENENDFSSEWSNDYNESNDSSEIIEEYNHEYNEANTRGLPDSETDADQAQESGSFCRCYALRTCRCRSLSPGMSNFSPRENRFYEISLREHGREILPSKSPNGREKRHSPFKISLGKFKGRISFQNLPSEERKYFPGRI